MDLRQQLRVELAAASGPFHGVVAPVFRQWPLAPFGCGLVLAIELLLGVAAVSLRSVESSRGLRMDLASGRCLGAGLGFLAGSQWPLWLGPVALLLDFQSRLRVFLPWAPCGRRLWVRPDLIPLFVHSEKALRLTGLPWTPGSRSCALRLLLRQSSPSSLPLPQRTTGPGQPRDQRQRGGARNRS